MADGYQNLYNPDVLSCLANLSNDEVFTPPEVANRMLDLLPQELFRSPDTTFLDPACKSGVFLREIAKRLLVGLEDEIPDLQQRVDHIFHKQLYGIAITELTSLLSYVMNILMSLMMLSMVFVMVTQSAAAAQRIEEVLEEQPDITSPENAVKTVKDGSIDFDHVTFAYQQRSGKPVLSDIDLHIQSGETIGIMGGTGSSKSSLVNLISRLYDVTAGEVRVGGVDVRRYDVESLRDAVSVVLQNNVLFSGTIYDNLRWGDKNATDEQCREACHLACADEFIKRFPEKYDTRIERGGTNVSGGQKQRLCIARALLKKPKVLILDDSTSAVDTATDAKIREAMRTHIPGTTKIIIAQRISSIQDADRVLVLDNGRVNAFDTPENLMKTNAIYQEVYNSQVGNGGGDFDEAAMKGGD